MVNLFPDSVFLLNVARFKKKKNPEKITFCQVSCPDQVQESANHQNTIEKMASINTPKACTVLYHFLGQHFIRNVRQF